FNQTGEQIKQTDEQMRRTDEQLKKQLGDLGNRFGEVEEYLVVPSIEDKFNELNYHFTAAVRNFKLMDENRKALAEIDIVLENDDFILCIEVKVKPTRSDVRNHIKRLKTAQRYYKKHRPKEMKIIGAIAGTAFRDELRDFVIANGLYVVVPSGNTFKIDVPKNFQPKCFYGD
ncbi:MAG: YraN family protein, partial [Planctomycetaceae bacterium]|nr:YraN family protein [Planctomycetaceae bacterium]